MELYYSFSILIVLASLFAFINHKYLKLPSTIGIMLIALLVSLFIRFAGPVLAPVLTADLTNLIMSIDFTELLMDCMLNFLLFAGAIHVNFSELKEQKLPVLTFSTISVIISTFVVGFIIYYLAPFFGFQLPLIYALLFGSLISPTDPIAVLGILKKANVSKSLEMKITGEALFNDGVAVVVFMVLLQIAGTPDIVFSMKDTLILFLEEAGGGIALGLLLGYTASRAMKSIDEYIVSVLITLSVVMGGFLLTKALHFSAPLAMVVAGLMIGNFGKKRIMSSETKEYVSKFWELIDEILNAMLFLFIGFELLLIRDFSEFFWISLSAIFVVLFARFISIWLPSKIVPFKPRLGKDTITMLVWGGLRGGVSIALVLAIKNPPGHDITTMPDYKMLLLEMTYFVVIFSIFVQGLTVGKVSKRIKDAKEHQLYLLEEAEQAKKELDADKEA